MFESIVYTEMEFFLPGIAALLIAGLIVFLVLPRLGAPVLAALSLALLAYGIYNHMQLFSSEYRYSTWQDRLKFYGPFLMIGGLVLVILMYMGFLFGTKGPEALPANNLMANATVNSAVNATVNTANNIGSAATEAVTNAVNAVAEVFGAGPNNRGNAANRVMNNRSGILANLGQILNTPFSNTRGDKNGIF
jgi:hypothetical protein